MEKYLVIIIAIIILYYLHNCWVENKIEKFMKLREGFTDAITTNGVDDSNAINILAKVAKDLQEGGGLKVLGNLEVKSNTVHIGQTTPGSAGYIKGGDGEMRFSYINGSDTYINSPHGWHFYNQPGGVAASIDKTGNTTVKGTIDTAKKLLVGTAGNQDGDILKVFTSKDTTKYVYANSNNELGMYDTNINRNIWAFNGVGDLTAKTVNADKLCIGGVCITGNQLRLLTEGFILKNAYGKANGYDSVHILGDGHLMTADDKYRTTLKMVNPW